MIENMISYWPRLFLAIMFTFTSAAFIRDRYQGRALRMRLFASFILSCPVVSIITEILMRTLYSYLIKPMLPRELAENDIAFAIFYIISDVCCYLLPIYIYSRLIDETYLVAINFYMQFVVIDRTTQVISFSPLTYILVLIIIILILRTIHKDELKYISANKATVDWRPLFYYTITLFLILDACYAAIFIFPEIQLNKLSVSSLWLDLIVTITCLSSIGFVKLNVRVGQEHDHKVSYMRKFQENQTDIIRDFATISEAKSGETGQHIRRVSEYVAILSKEILQDEREISYVKIASMMHDIGKLMIPNEIIEKPGKLTKEEYETIKKHSAYGESLLSRSEGEIMTIAQTIAYEHHERWDGHGYPRGLKGNEISIYAQIVSVADVYDALTSKRSYKDPWPAEQARKEIIGQRGYQFSPIVVDSFIKRYNEIDEIRKMYAD